MKHYPLIVLSLLVLVLAGCSKHANLFRLEGEFRNMNQADLYVYDMSKGTKDTIHVQRGRFIYETIQEDTATLMLIFPNFSSIPIYANSGITVEMKGDASHLKETKLSGSKENEEMTAFRLKANQLTPPDVQQIAKTFIMEEPTSPVSFFLLRRYFVEAVSNNYHEAYRLCNVMLSANPNNLEVLRLRDEVKILLRKTEQKRLPRFAVLDTKGKVITNHDLKKDVNVICLWSSWNYDSRSQLTTLKRLQKDYPKQLMAMGISIDAARYESRDWLRRDSIEFPIVIDGKMWQTPLAKALGMTDVPSNVVVDKKGKIISRDSPIKRLKGEIEKLLKKDEKK